MTKNEKKEVYKGMIEAILIIFMWILLIYLSYVLPPIFFKYEKELRMPQFESDILNPEETKLS